ncbi:MAG: HNH endonuclease, partial [Spirochaetia bacterium]
MNNRERALSDLRQTLVDFESVDSHENIRDRVLSLVPAVDALRELGKSLISEDLTLPARDRLLKYFRLYPLTVLNHKELAIVAGISDWPRRVRELRVEHGWKIVSGVTAKEMLQEDDILRADLDLGSMGPKDYALLSTEQDREAAYRWNLANEIRKQKGAMKDRLLEYLQGNVGKEVTGEELRYVAKGSEWARRVRELRTEDGFPISTKLGGNPNLGVGVYVLEENRQTPKHDRSIPDSLRREVLRRDGYVCNRCGWSHSDWNRSDPRFLEIH